MFRTNLFLMAFSLPPALVALDELQKWLSERELLGRTGRLIVPAFCALFFLTFVPLDLDYFSTKAVRMSRTCYVRHAMEMIYQTERNEPAPESEAPDNKRPLLRPHACSIWLSRLPPRGAKSTMRFRALPDGLHGQKPRGAVDDHVGAAQLSPARATRDRTPVRPEPLPVDHRDFPMEPLLRCRGRTE
jgi:hypothetical protein